MNRDLSPLAAAARLAGRRGRVVLHSARDDDGLGTATYVAADPVATLEVRGASLLERDRRGGVVRQWDADPITAIEAFARAHGADLRAAVPALTAPAVIGYFGYELGAVIEPSAG